jgi:hypothetical protein
MPVGWIEEILRLGSCERCAAVGNMAGVIVGLPRIGCSGVDAERPIWRGLVGAVGKGDEGNNKQREDKQ